MKRPTIIEAAREFGVCHFKLYAVLRQQNIIGSRNIACRRYAIEGWFINEPRAFTVPGTNVTRQYTVSLVTPKGMSLLQDIIDAQIRAGNDLRSAHAIDAAITRAHQSAAARQTSPTQHGAK
jgi:hypothetical protein